MANSRGVGGSLNTLRNPFRRGNRSLRAGIKLGARRCSSGSAELRVGEHGPPRPHLLLERGELPLQQLARSGRRGRRGRRAGNPRTRGRGARGAEGSEVRAGCPLGEGGVNARQELSDFHVLHSGRRQRSPEEETSTPSIPGGSAPEPAIRVSRLEPKLAIALDLLPRIDSEKREPL